MVDGDPGDDIWAMDVARYGSWATLAYTNAKVRENYSRRFRITFPVQCSWWAAELYR